MQNIPTSTTPNKSLESNVTDIKLKSPKNTTTSPTLSTKKIAEPAKIKHQNNENVIVMNNSSVMSSNIITTSTKNGKPINENFQKAAAFWNQKQ